MHFIDFFAIKTCLIITLIFQNSAQIVYKAHDSFYSYHCPIGAQSTGSYGCITPQPQLNVINTALSLVQISKNTMQLLHFQATLSSTNSTLHIISLTITQPSSTNIRTGFFIVFIKTQPVDQFIDIIQINVISGTSLDTFTASTRTLPLSSNISTNTIFDTGTAGLTAIPFTTSWKMTNSATATDSNLVIMMFKVSTTISGGNVNFYLQVAPQVSLSGYKGFVVLVNTSKIATFNGSNMNYLFKIYIIQTSINRYVNLSIQAPGFGPPFNQKCLLGIYQQQYIIQNFIDYYFWGSNKGNIQVLQQSINQNYPLQRGNIFCFGIYGQCQQEATHIDGINNNCYTSNTCPLPVPGGWNITDMCPNCTQQACQLCNVSNRSSCSICKTNTNTYLNASRCVCNTNYYPINMFIDTSTLGLWNNENQSLLYCQLNCSAALVGCSLTNCTNSTYCTECSPRYYVKNINIANHICELCSVPLPNCVECASSINCTLCNDGYFTFDQFTLVMYVYIRTKCQLCSDHIHQCTNCSDNNTCFNCSAGYVLTALQDNCTCDFSLIPNCTNCTVGFVCSSCVTGFFVNISTGNCSQCFNIRPACTLCSNYTTCTACTNNSYILDSTSNSSMTVCTLCGSLIKNCTTCNTTSTCTNCDLYYGLNSTLKCQKCDILLGIPGCQTCQNQSLCLTCNSSSFYINSSCYICQQIISNCQSCTLLNGTMLDCINCEPGYYIELNVYVGINECKICLNNYPNCFLCNSSSIGCISCYLPYLIGSPGTCDQCVAGYQYDGGFCLKLAGCQSIVVLSNGTQMCIACVISLNFVYDQSLKKCVCGTGYKETIPLNRLARCVHICGDGMITSQEQCDDKNTNNNDGCNSNCMIQSDFQCFFQPSQCILHVDINAIVYSHVYRQMPDNKAIIYYIIEPRHIAFQSLKWQNILNFNFSHTSLEYSSVKYSYSQNTGMLAVSFDYKEQLQSTVLLSNFSINPNYIVSRISSFLLTNQLNGINFPLTFQSEQSIQTHKNINIISIVVMLLLLLQFYIGSFFHKMIGLQTIQVIQVVYFVRMLVYSNVKNILSSMNPLQYSAAGYQNSQIIFGQQEQLQIDSQTTINSQFIAIKMQKYFLLNVNFFILPLALSVIMYITTLIRKYKQRANYMQNFQPQFKDKYVKLRRSAQWIYDHFVFPYTIMFNAVIFFNAIIYISAQKDRSDQLGKTQNIQKYSFSVHLIALFFTLAIFSFQLLKSLNDYNKYRMTSAQRNSVPQSLVQKLQHDQNNPDRANYHPFYVFIYLLFYFILWFIMTVRVFFEGFTISLQVIMGLSVAYFLFVCFWKPYHETVNLHNHFLKLNHGFVAVFLIICMVFQFYKGLSSTFLTVILYTTMSMLGLIMIGGFIRIYKQVMFRKLLERTNDLLDYDQQNKNDGQQISDRVGYKNFNQQNKKKSNIFINNQYSFINQVKDIALKHGHDQISNKIQNHKKIQSEQEQKIIKIIRQDTARKHNISLLNELLQMQKQENIKNQKYKERIIKQIQKYNNDKDKYLEKQVQNLTDIKIKSNDQEFTNCNDKLKNTQSDNIALKNIMEPNKWLNMEIQFQISQIDPNKAGF